VLYIGVTGNLHRRYQEHKQGLVEGFSKKYRCHNLVYVELYSNVNDAISREKQMKGWRRSKKMALIEMDNPQWNDIYVGDRSLDSASLRSG